MIICKKYLDTYCDINKTKQRDFELLVSCLHNHLAHF